MQLMHAPCEMRFLFGCMFCGHIMLLLDLRCLCCGCRTRNRWGCCGQRSRCSTGGCFLTLIRCTCVIFEMIVESRHIVCDMLLIGVVGGVMVNVRHDVLPIVRFSNLDFLDMLLRLFL